MNIESFKVFCDLCDTGSFSRAAEASGITQSAVSQQIRAVEKNFGIPLVDRSSSTFTLTPEGLVYLDACRDILARFDSLGTRFRIARGALEGKLHLASVISIALHNLPPILKQFRKSHPGVEITVDYRKAEEVYRAVEDGRADLGLVAYPKARPGLRAITCWQERLVLTLPPGHPLAGKRPVSLSQLQGERFIQTQAGVKQEDGHGCVALMGTPAFRITQAGQLQILLDGTLQGILLLLVQRARAMLGLRHAAYILSRIVFDQAGPLCPGHQG